eukprot:jgi/Ulvmu1/12776/UM097_0003.1
MRHALLCVSVGLAFFASAFGSRLLEPVFSTVVELGQDNETGLDTDATIYCTVNPVDPCKHEKLRTHMSQPPGASAPIAVVLPGAARPMDNYSKVATELAYRGFFVMVMEQLVDITVPDDPRLHFANFTDVNLIPASVIPQALHWIEDEYLPGTVPMLPCTPPNQDSVALIGHALGARAAKAMLYMHQPANVIPVGPVTLEFTPQLPSLPYLPQIKGAFCYGLSEPEFAIEEYALHGPPRNDTVFLVANGDLELDNIDGGPVVVEDVYNPRDAYLILDNMDHISIVDDALRGNPLAGDRPPPGGGAAAPAAAPFAAAAATAAAPRPAAVAPGRPAPPERATAERSTRPREEQVAIVSQVALAAARTIVCPALDSGEPPAVPEYVEDMFGTSEEVMELWLEWIEHP